MRWERLDKPTYPKSSQMPEGDQEGTLELGIDLLLDVADVRGEFTGIVQLH